MIHESASSSTYTHTLQLCSADCAQHIYCHNQCKSFRRAVKLPGAHDDFSASLKWSFVSDDELEPWWRNIFCCPRVIGHMLFSGSRFRDEVDAFIHKVCITFINSDSRHLYKYFISNKCYLFIPKNSMYHVFHKIWTIFNTDNNEKYFLSSKSAYYNDFWRSCDTDDCSNDAENTTLITEINYILLYNKHRYHSYFKTNNISNFYSIFVKINTALAGIFQQK